MYGIHLSCITLNTLYPHEFLPQLLDPYFYTVNSAIFSTSLYAVHSLPVHKAHFMIYFVFYKKYQNVEAKIQLGLDIFLTAKALTMVCDGHNVTRQTSCLPRPRPWCVMVTMSSDILPAC